MGVNVAQGVDGHAPEHGGGVVAAAVGGAGVPVFVHGQGQQNARQGQKQGDDRPPRVVEQLVEPGHGNISPFPKYYT